MELTQPIAWIGQYRPGYMLNAEFSQANKAALQLVLNNFESHFKKSVFIMPISSLHITLLDWIAPLVEYKGQDKDRLFSSIRAEYDSAISEILNSIGPIKVHFKEIGVSPSTIYIVGQDNGEFQTIRDKFLHKVSLLPNTKQPPKIIHSSLARFVKAIAIKPVENYIRNIEIDLVQEISNFRLVHSTIEPMLEFEVLKRYKLGIN